jgi:superfamily II DNA or RNA helicase
MRRNHVLDGDDAVVVDEFHHLGAHTALVRLLPKMEEKDFVLGLPSLPEREDMKLDLILKDFPISYDLSLGNDTRKGYVSPPPVNTPAGMTKEERERYEDFAKKIQLAFRNCGPDIRKWRSDAAN